MKILPVYSSKGGEGKSTHAANLAGLLADAGLKTLLLDADWSQPTASSIFTLAKEAPFGLYELLMQTIPDPLLVISQTSINNLDLIYSNDPDELLPTAMLHAADGRIRLRNILQHPTFASYDVIIIDCKGATGVMTELSILASTGRVMGVVKPILPDVREFIRGSPVCKGPTRKRKGKNGDFWGCLRYPDCNGIVAGKRKKQAGRRGKTGAARAKITAKQ